MKSAALALRFLLELAALAALVYSGVAVLGGGWGWLAGLAAATVAAVVWGLFVAPRATIVLRTTARVTIEFAVFITASVGLLLAQRPLLAIGLTGLHLIDRLMLRLSGAPVFEPHPDPARSGQPRT